MDNLTQMKEIAKAIGELREFQNEFGEMVAAFSRKTESPGLAVPVYERLTALARKLGAKEQLTTANIIPVISSAVDKLLAQLTDVQALKMSGRLDPDIEERMTAARGR